MSCRESFRKKKFLAVNCKRNHCGMDSIAVSCTWNFLALNHRSTESCWIATVCCNVQTSSRSLLSYRHRLSRMMRAARFPLADAALIAGSSKGWPTGSVHSPPYRFALQYSEKVSPNKTVTARNSPCCFPTMSSLHCGTLAEDAAPSGFLPLDSRAMAGLMGMAPVSSLNYGHSKHSSPSSPPQAWN